MYLDVSLSPLIPTATMMVDLCKIGSSHGMADSRTELATPNWHNKCCQTVYMCVCVILFNSVPEKGASNIH